MAATYPIHLPQVYQEWCDTWSSPAARAAAIDQFTSGACSFIPGLLPEHLLTLSAETTLAIYRQRYGELAEQALAAETTDPATSANELPAALRGPVARHEDAHWITASNMVGVNVRTVGSFWNVAKYALSLPAAQDSIHLLPIWEPGVVGSLYGMSSWELNPEFFSEELAELCPWLDTTERQLRAVVNLLHVAGRSVGMDVIPHTDRFSEMVLAHPEHFEWLQRQDTEIVRFGGTLYEKVQDAIVSFLAAYGPAKPGMPLPETRADLFGPAVPETTRLLLLFGPPENRELRGVRRNQLIAAMVRYGYEPIPATMAPPFRGLTVDTRPEGLIQDMHGNQWREYTTLEPTGMSRVFGPLARYHLFEPAAPGSWVLDFSKPRRATWNYVCQHYADVQQCYGFDFMRGDMAHVQMRPEGAPDHVDAFYDILGAVKRTVRERGVRHFGYFAESFLGPRDVFGYGEEIDHLEAAQAETTLGDLQSIVFGSPEFLQRFRAYDDLANTRACVPAFTVMTADKDDPRFDLFYQTGNAARLFSSLLLGGTPSYMGLGFETRDLHMEPAPNEHYTKLYVFHESHGPKATHGPYVWGHNATLFHTITRLRLLLDTIWPEIGGQPTRWLLAPDATGESPLLAWTQRDTARYVYVVNTSAERSLRRVALPGHALAGPLVPIFSTEGEPAPKALAFNGRQHLLPHLAPGEAVVLRVGE